MGPLVGYRYGANDWVQVWGNSSTDMECNMYRYAATQV